MCAWGRQYTQAPSLSHQVHRFLNDLVASFSAICGEVHGESKGKSLGITCAGRKGEVPAPVERWTMGPHGNSLWRDHNSYLLCRAGNGALRGHLLFIFWSVTGPGHTYISHSCKKKHQQHCSLHLSFSHASPTLLVLSQPGLIGYTANTGTMVLCKVAHSQEAYVHKAVTVAG